MSVTDMNRDNIPDLIGFGSSGLAVRLGDGSGFLGPEVPVFPLPVQFAVNDFNGDGAPDIAVLLGGGGVAPFLNVSRPPPELSVVSAASLAAGALAPDSIASAFGQNLAAGVVSASVALPTSLSGITVSVEDAAGTTRSAPLFFASRNQVNFLVPSGTALGPAAITVGGTLSSKPLTARVRIEEVAPALFSAGSRIAAANIVYVAPGETQTVVPAFTVRAGEVLPAPIDVTQPGRVFLVLFGTGFRSRAGAPTVAEVQGMRMPVTCSGPQSTLPGLDQINVQLLPELAGTGVARVSLSIGTASSNAVLVTIQ
jgi:uncharacterized protein (TIGR03437 family)